MGTKAGDCCFRRTHFDFVQLPTKYESLYATVLQTSKCPTNGTPIQDPALCLRCGAVLCAGGKCCKRNEVGACTRHAKSCCGGSAIFLLVSRCQILLVRGPWAAMIEAPYVDAYGEQDP